VVSILNRKDTLMPKMTVSKFLTSQEYGCATSGELIGFSRIDPEGFKLLKVWAEEEMKNRGIEVEKPA